MGLKYSTIFVFVLLIHLVLYNLSSIDTFNPSSYSEDVENYEKEYFISYLGMTYDIIKGNPLGDPLFLTDLGYKRYVLKNKIELDNNLINDEDKNNKISYTVSENVKMKCLHSRKPTIINELSDINKEYENYKFPSQYEIYPFNASNYYKLLTQRINKGDSIIIDKKICSKYFVSLNEVNTDNLDPFFLSILNELGNNYQEIKGDKYKCDVHFYKRNKYDKKCLKTIAPWITFFNLYGTHLISGAYFGGRIINNLYVENENIKSGSYEIKLDKRKLNPFHNSNSNLNFGSIISNEKIIYIKERNLMLYGGNIVRFENSLKKNSYKKWEESIKGIFAKPIKLTFIPFAELIMSEYGKIAYYEALEFYSNLTYSNYNPYNFQLNKSEEDLYKMYIKKWNQSIEKNVNVNTLPKCKTGDKIISGFIITNKKNLYNDNNIMHICPSTNDCSSGVNIQNDKSFEFGWILCSYENIYEIKQIKKIVQGKGKITCPLQMKIGFGFAFTVQKSISTIISIEPCKSNKKNCKSKNIDENSQSIFWINCLPNHKQKLLETLESKAYTERIHLDDSAVFSLKCSEEKYIIAGFAVDYISSNAADYVICPVGSSACDLKIHVEEMNNNELHIPIIYIVCSSL